MVFPRHPLFLLPRQGEETEEVRENPNITRPPWRPSDLPNLCRIHPPDDDGGESEQKPTGEGAQRPTPSGPIS